MVLGGGWAVVVFMVCGCGVVGVACGRVLLLGRHVCGGVVFVCQGRERVVGLHHPESLPLNNVAPETNAHSPSEEQGCNSSVHRQESQSFDSVAPVLRWVGFSGGVYLLP